MGSNKVTPKSRTLGGLLGEERRKAKLTLREFADILRKRTGKGWDAGTLSRLENGTRTVKPADVAMMLTELGVAGARYDEILGLTEEPEVPPGWLAVSTSDQRRHLSALIRFEHEASMITSVSPLIVPGLLQKREYIRAIMTGGSVPSDEVDTRIATRLGRQEVLKHIKMIALLGEAALRQEIGGRDVLREQLTHLVEMSATVDIRVIPFVAGWHPALEGPWTVIEFDEAPTVIHVENRVSGQMLDEEPGVTAYLNARSAVIEKAMSSEASVELIASVINELESRQE